MQDEVQWANSTEPYRKNAGILEMTGMKVENAPTSLTSGALLTSRYRSSYGMNGLLHTISTTEVGSPSRVPMLWPVHGAIIHDGMNYAAPYLICPNTNAGCRFNSGGSPNGQAGSGWGAQLPWYTNFGGDYSYWAYNQAIPIVNTDTSAKTRKVGGPPFQWTQSLWTEPFQMWDSQGIEWGYYGCAATSSTIWYYPCYFRPDRDAFGQG